MIKRDDIIDGWRCVYASPFRYDFRLRDGEGVIQQACVYQPLTTRKWRAYYTPGSANRTLLRSVRLRFKGYSSLTKFPSRPEEEATELDEILGHLD
jgi:hypothetical protein